MSFSFWQSHTFSLKDWRRTVYRATRTWGKLRTRSNLSHNLCLHNDKTIAITSDLLYHRLYFLFQLALRTVNSSRSAYACFVFAPSFFLHYNDGVPDENEDSEEDALKCKIGVKVSEIYFETVHRAWGKSLFHKGKGGVLFIDARSKRKRWRVAEKLEFVFSCKLNLFSIPIRRVEIF